MQVKIPDGFVLEREQVLRFFGKTETDLAEDVKRIREWMRFQPHLPPLNDARIEFIIVQSKFSLEKAKKRIDDYLSVRSFVPEIFDNRDPCTDTDIINTNQIWTMALMKNYTSDWSRVGVAKFTSSRTDIYSPIGIVKTIVNGLDMRYCLDLCTEDIVIVDLEHFTLGHVKKLTPTFLKKSFSIILKSYGYRMRQIHVINANPATHAFFSMVKMFMKPKLISKIHFHQTIDGVYEYVDKAALPSDYGGEQQSTAELHEQMVNEQRECRQFYIDEMKLKTNEKLRPANSKSEIFESLRGLDGSFRQLAVD